MRKPRTDWRKRLRLAALLSVALSTAPHHSGRAAETCENPGEACTKTLRSECLFTLGAGAAAQQGPNLEACARQLQGYRDCLSKQVELCSASGVKPIDFDRDHLVTARSFAGVTRNTPYSAIVLQGHFKGYEVKPTILYAPEGDDPFIRISVYDGDAKIADFWEANGKVESVVLLSSRLPDHLGLRVGASFKETALLSVRSCKKLFEESLFQEYGALECAPTYEGPFYFFEAKPGEYTTKGLGSDAGTPLSRVDPNVVVSAIRIVL